ncbi:tetratricopeptide repeat protein [Novosphingobium guangzhouense]|uniref:Tetratricopeptide repeat protein n=1 Tax=Novosphingobium guangzhouense TaxID=1850347 RepID=A0A2K2G528_9SPHN|nr:tetratricopeptide repeat protein [Novosphingobium guangzhouense]PNU06143.1 hypothetical protein A8V01_12340 [Novosphingobium guangzhouense]
MRSIERIALPFVAALALTACGDSPETLFATARNDFAAGNYEQARLEVAAALKKQPRDIAMLTFLVETQLRLGDPDAIEGAIRRLERAGGAGTGRMKAELALLRGNARAALDALGDDASATGWRVRGEAHLALGDKQQAQAAFEAGLKAGDDIRLAQSYARYLLQNGKLDRAAALLRDMQRIAPHSYETLTMVGDLALAQQRSDDAARAYRAAIDAFPDRAASMLALADIYGENGQYELIAPLLDRASAIEPENPAIMTMRLRLLAQQRRWRDIRDMLQTHESQLEPGSEAVLIYARALLELGQPGQARLLAGRALLMQPGNRDAAEVQARARLAGGDPQGAWDTLRQMASSTLVSSDVLKAAARAAQEVHAPEAAALDRRAEPARLARTQALASRGEAALAKQDWAAAAAAYRGLLEQGEDAEILARLAYVASRMGHGREAVAYADRAMAADGSAQYVYVAGQARLDSRIDLQRAIALLERAVAADPDNATFAQALEQANAAAG